MLWRLPGDKVLQGKMEVPLSMEGGGPRRPSLVGVHWLMPSDVTMAPFQSWVLRAQRREIRT